MKRIFAIFTAMVFASGLAMADTTSYSTLTVDQEDHLNTIGASSAVASARKVQLGTLLDELIDRTDAVVVTDAASVTLSSGNSGKTHILPDLTADITITLPTEASGLSYRFIYGGNAADAQDWIIDSGSNTNYFNGGLVQHDTDDAGDDTVTYFSDGNSNSKVTVYTPAAGTEVEIHCDGTNWYVNGVVISATDTGVAFADQ